MKLKKYKFLYVVTNRIRFNNFQNEINTFFVQNIFMCKNVKRTNKEQRKMFYGPFNFEIIIVVKNGSALCTVNSFIYSHFLFQSS